MKLSEVLTEERFGNRYDYEEFVQRLRQLSSRGEPLRAKDELGHPLELRFDRENQQWIHSLTQDTFDTEELATVLSQDNDGQYHLSY